MRTALLIIGVLASPFARGEGAGLSPERLDFFEKRIRPVLANECYECHGPSKQRHGLRLDSRQGMLTGGENGPVLVPGKPGESLLIKAIKHEHPEFHMPKDRPKLGESVIADFTRWIADGAADPRDQPEAAGSAGSWESKFETRRDWWSFKPVQPPAIPSGAAAAWSKHPVDRLLAAKMLEKGLKPAQPADKTTLLRRVTFLLTGLPPTPEEQAAFLRDHSREAYPKVVERLLASPRFGEHWARHWMDLVRFAETHGSESDPDIPEAWRFRDYLIRAFNADVPIDQLIREQIAGDLIPHQRINDAEGLNESVIGLAQFRMVEHGFQPVDALEEQVKTVDNQIDVLSKAFQGLTVSCARCHDHKFDPISQKDYYALYGVMASFRPANITIDKPEILRVHRSELESLKAEIRRGLAQEWTLAASRLAADLKRLTTEGTGNRLTVRGDEDRTQMAAYERGIREIEQSGRIKALKVRAPGALGALGAPEPQAVWTFDADGRDAIGGLEGELVGGAVVRGGRLVLDGKGAYLKSAPLKQPLREKTLEAWVSPATLDQTGGGVIGVEHLNGSVFDSIVFAERDARKWMAGSEGFARTRALDGPQETAKLGEWVHVALVYQADGSIAFFRNGVPYGAAYKPDGDKSAPHLFPAAEAHLIFGMRHLGGGNAFFKGEIDEARLYARALKSDEVAASFKAGPGLVTAEQITQALSPEERAERDRLSRQLADLRGAFHSKFPEYEKDDARRNQLESALNQAAKDESHPLHYYTRSRSSKSSAQESAAWQSRQREAMEAARKWNAEKFTTRWNLAGADAGEWFRSGVNPPEVVAAPGEFTIEPEGDSVLKGLWPAGVFTHRLSQKHNGVLASPRFKVESDYISVRVVGGKGARVRVVVDNYPIGAAGIYPQANINSDAPTWIRLDVTYRKGSMVHLEFATAEEVTSRDRSGSGAGGRSYFGVERVVFHDAKETPKNEILPEGEAISPAPLEEPLGKHLAAAIKAWGSGAASAKDVLLLDSFIRAKLLPVRVDELGDTAKLVAEYRRIESQIPVARRAPGVLEASGFDAPLLTRGDHHKPKDPVPRGYLQVVSGRTFNSPRSGRLELAEEMTSPTNPLTARVMANRVWHHLFGKGLVPTVDNFGRLGEKPTHPELVDFLADHLVKNGWSLKELVRYLVLTRAFQLSGEPSKASLASDPANDWLSHARVRRLEAESIRDSLLAISGQLETRMYGPGEGALAEPKDQKRRSVYTTIRRNFLSPFLEVFDAPRPFTTLGRREATNVPAQSLALLNDPFVIHEAERWAAKTSNLEDAARIEQLFESAFGRPASEPEIQASKAYLAQASGDGEKTKWRDLAQSIFNLKEFIYLR